MLSCLPLWCLLLRYLIGEKIFNDYFKVIFISTRNLIYFKKFKFQICVSQNFNIRENPTYYYILGIIEKNSGNYPDALNFLSTALNLMSNKSTEINPTDTATIYVELIDTLNVVGQSDEATKTLEVAINELKGTPEEAR